MKELIDLFNSGNYTLVVGKNGPAPDEREIRIYNNRGVADLLRLYRKDPEFLQGSLIADKVIGKGAAALMILGGVKECHTPVLSRHGKEFFDRYGMNYRCCEVVDHIINRAGTGWCPIETRCRDLETPEECLRAIEEFCSSRQ